MGWFQKNVVRQLEENYVRLFSNKLDTHVEVTIWHTLPTIHNLKREFLNNNELLNLFATIWV